MGSPQFLKCGVHESEISQFRRKCIHQKFMILQKINKFHFFLDLPGVSSLSVDLLTDGFLTYLTELPAGAANIKLKKQLS